MADGEIVADDRDWVNWDIRGSAESEFSSGLCEGRIPVREFENVTYLDRVELAGK
jgi:hypothetical protein